MSIEENKIFIRRYYEATGSEDMVRQIREAENPEVEVERVLRAAFAQTFSPDCVVHYPDGDRSIEEDTMDMVMILTAFPDLKCTVEDVIAEGDKVVTRFTVHGTHEAPFRGIPATGKHIEVKSVSIKRIANGKVIEDWMFQDMLGLMQQLGVFPKQ